MSEPHGRREVLGLALGGLGLLAAACTGRPRAEGPHDGALDVRDFGTVGDGVALDTAALQAAVDAAHVRGGGTVVLPAGRFLSGTIVLRSGVTLHLASGAVLLGSPRIADYPARPFPARDLDVGGNEVWALLYAQDAVGVAVEGAGVIDGNGASFPKVPIVDPAVAAGPRPRTVFFRNCRSVVLRDVTVRESGMWAVHLALCDAVRIDRLRVTSSRHLHQDGIVLDSCRDAVVADCAVDTLDDAIVLKSSFPRPCTDVAITRCLVRSACAGVKLGTQSLGGFRGVTVSDCVFRECRLGGLKVQTVDGGDLEDVTVRDVVMHDVAAPLAIRRGARGFDYGFAEVARPRPVGRLRGVTVRGLRAVLAGGSSPRSGHTMSVAGLPGHPVEDVVLEGLDVTFPGGGTPEEARRTGIPERETAYPEHDMFGVLPAYGLWARHATGVTVRSSGFTLGAPDARAALLGEDVTALDVAGLEERAWRPGG